MKSLALVSPVLCLVLALPAPARADGGADGSHVPTRLQLCNHELRGLPAEQRGAQINTCLQRRASAEVTVERTCKRETQAIKGETHRQTAQMRRVAMRNCMANALSRPYAELPGAGGTRRTGAAMQTGASPAKSF
jgi:hypothetical protein